LVLASVAVAVTGCGGPGPVEVSDVSPADPIAKQCSQVLDALPMTVVGEDRRETVPHDALAAAWGDPPIVLRCGVERPDALQPTSFCLRVNSLGWLATQDGREVDMMAPVEGTTTFTTIGRSVYVEVAVPATYAPQADVLIDVAQAIRSATTGSLLCT
jgi:hypothetical protein